MADVPQALATTKTTAPASPEDFYLPAAKKAIRDRIALVVEVEGPIHEDLCMRRVLAAWGITKTTARPRARLEEEIAALAEAKKVARRGEFLWRAGEDAAAFDRIRGAAPEGETRDAEHLPPEEVAAAVARVLEANLSLERADLAKEAARLLGYGRAGKALAERVDAAVTILAAQGALAIEGERIHWRR